MGLYAGVYQQTQNWRRTPTGAVVVWCLFLFWKQSSLEDHIVTHVVDVFWIGFMASWHLHVLGKFPHLAGNRPKIFFRNYIYTCTYAYIIYIYIYIYMYFRKHKSSRTPAWLKDWFVLTMIRVENSLPSGAVRCLVGWPADPSPGRCLCRWPLPTAGGGKIGGCRVQRTFWW